MFKKITLTLALTLLSATATLAFNYIEPPQMKEMLEKKKPVILLDIQVAKDFENHHLPGSVETNSYPTKSDDEKKQLDKIIPTIKVSKDPVVVICPSGKGGATRSVDYLKSQGIAEERIQILSGGISGWPYKELIVKGR